MPIIYSVTILFAPILFGLIAWFLYKLINGAFGVFKRPYIVFGEMALFVGSLLPVIANGINFFTYDCNQPLLAIIPIGIGRYLIDFGLRLSRRVTLNELLTQSKNYAFCSFIAYSVLTIYIFINLIHAFDLPWDLYSKIPAILYAVLILINFAMDTYRFRRISFKSKEYFAIAPHVRFIKSIELKEISSRSRTSLFDAQQAVTRELIKQCDSENQQEPIKLFFQMGVEIDEINGHGDDRQEEGMHFFAKALFSENLSSLNPVTAQIPGAYYAIFDYQGALHLVYLYIKKIEQTWVQRTNYKIDFSNIFIEPVGFHLNQEELPTHFKVYLKIS